MNGGHIKIAVGVTAILIWGLGRVWFHSLPIEEVSHPEAAIQAQAATDELPDPCGLIDVVCPWEAEYNDPVTIEARIRSAALVAYINPDTAVRIATCESNLDPKAINPNSTATGLFQFTDATWYYIGSPGDRQDADANMAAFMTWYPKHPEWWVCK